jgi:ferredoxin-NADP reductase
VLISGGSGITPVLSMLRTLRDEGHDGEIVFVHYARTAADWLYRDELAGFPGVRVEYVATREGGGHVTEAVLDGALDGALAAVCGPPALIEAVRAFWPDPQRLLTETFTPPRLSTAGGTGTIHFTRSGRSVAAGDGSLLEQAEAAGLEPEFGCRMGICHTCTCRKAAGPVRNALTGEVSHGEDEDIQLCISVPAGDVALEL